MITFDQVDAFLSYDDATGVITWKVKRKKMEPGSEAGCRNHQGYVVLSLFGRQYQAHRVAWLLHYGEWPKGGLDHKDHDRANNRIANLRLASHVENCRNQRRVASNTTGFKGVSPDGRGRFRAIAYNQGLKVSLGSYGTAELAHSAYCAYAKLAFGNFWSPG